MSDNSNKNPLFRDYDDLLSTVIANGGKEFWAVYPFKAGTICELLPKGRYPEYDFHTGKLLYSQIPFIEKTIGGLLDISSLRAFLEQKCHVSQLENMKWNDILAHIRLYGNQQIPAQVEQEQPETISIKDFIRESTQIETDGSIRQDRYNDRKLYDMALNNLLNSKQKIFKNNATLPPAVISNKGRNPAKYNREAIRLEYERLLKDCNADLPKLKK